MAIKIENKALKFLRILSIIKEINVIDFAKS